MVLRKWLFMVYFGCFFDIISNSILYIVYCMKQLSDMYMHVHIKIFTNNSYTRRHRGYSSYAGWCVGVCYHKIKKLSYACTGLWQKVVLYSCYTHTHTHTHCTHTHCTHAYIIHTGLSQYDIKTPTCTLCRFSLVPPLTYL